MDNIEKWKFTINRDKAVVIIQIVQNPYTDFRSGEQCDLSQEIPTPQFDQIELEMCQSMECIRPDSLYCKTMRTSRYGVYTTYIINMRVRWYTRRNFCGR